jgi:hypothetical protein
MTTEKKPINLKVVRITSRQRVQIFNQISCCILSILINLSAQNSKYG